MFGFVPVRLLVSYSVYLLQCADGSYYCGYAKDLAVRVIEHNTSNKGAKYTRGRRPVKLVWNERCGGISEALKREHQIKRLTRQQKEALVSE